MKDLKKIEELLEKYYRGETSTEEETALRDYFSSSDVPERLRTEAKLFGFFSREREGTLSGEMKTRLENMIPGPERRSFNVGINLRYYWISGAAAVILILLGIFADMQIRKNRMFEVRQDTYEDPYIAYAEARKVLYMVSDKLNTARQPLRNLEKLETSVDYMHPVFSFGAGIQHLEHFSTIEKTRKKLSE
jgi:hypothetical protein